METTEKTTAGPSWANLLHRPQGMPPAPDLLPEPRQAAPHIFDWRRQAAPATSPLSPPPRRRLLSVLCALASRYADLTRSPLSPLAALLERRLERFYLRALTDRGQAKRWADNYLRGLAMPAGALVLDHGCGRGRNLGHLGQLGFSPCGQDVYAHPWWDRLPHCRLQVVPPSMAALPWNDGLFDATLSIGVIGHFSPMELLDLAREMHRVLKPGGTWIILETNANGLNPGIPRRYYGRAHMLPDVAQTAARAGLAVLDSWHEGFFAPCCPVLFNALRKGLGPWPFDVADYASLLGRLTPEDRRAHWVLRLRKPD